MARVMKSGNSIRNRSALGLEAAPWATAEPAKPARNVAAEYNGARPEGLVLGLLFLKYISDAFEEKHAALEKEKGADPEDRDYSLSASNAERTEVRCRNQNPWKPFDSDPKQAKEKWQSALWQHHQLFQDAVN